MPKPTITDDPCLGPIVTDPYRPIAEQKEDIGTDICIATTGVLCGGYAWACKKLGRKPSNWGYAACTAIGVAAGVITNRKTNNKKNHL